MRKYLSSILLSSFLATGFVGVSSAVAASDEELIKNAESAAPAAVAKNAAVMNWDMKTLREGTNGFTCLPDDTSTTTINDPMCVDKNGLAFHDGRHGKEGTPARGWVRLYAARWWVRQQCRSLCTSARRWKVGARRWPTCYDFWCQQRGTGYIPTTEVKS